MQRIEDMEEKEIYNFFDDDVTESTEKMFAPDTGGKFEIVLDIVKFSTAAKIEE